jgi:hypothetical protein
MARLFGEALELGNHENENKLLSQGYHVQEETY